jgi:hypothetical protein
LTSNKSIHLIDPVFKIKRAARGKGYDKELVLKENVGPVTELTNEVIETRRPLNFGDIFMKNEKRNKRRSVSSKRQKNKSLSRGKKLNKPSKRTLGLSQESSSKSDSGFSSNS